MNRAKKEPAVDRAGNPCGPSVVPLKKYSTRKLRTGGQRRPLDPGESTFDAFSEEAALFEQQVMDRHDGTLPPPSILDDFSSEVVPVILRAYVGVQVRAHVLRDTAIGLASFATSSAKSVLSVLGSFAMKTAKERI